MSIMTADSKAKPNVLFFSPSLSALSGSKELTTSHTSKSKANPPREYTQTFLLCTCFFLYPFYLHCIFVYFYGDFYKLEYCKSSH